MQEAELERMKRKTVSLRKQVVREQHINEIIKERTGYSNPAKLINHIRAHKARE